MPLRQVENVRIPVISDPAKFDELSAIAYDLYLISCKYAVCTFSSKCSYNCTWDVLFCL